MQRRHGGKSSFQHTHTALQLLRFHVLALRIIKIVLCCTATQDSVMLNDYYVGTEYYSYTSSAEATTGVVKYLGTHDSGPPIEK